MLFLVNICNLLAGLSSKFLAFQDEISLCLVACGKNTSPNKIKNHLLKIKSMNFQYKGGLNHGSVEILPETKN